MTPRLRKLAALFTRRLVAATVFWFAVACWVMASVLAFRLGEYQEAAIQATLSAIVASLAWGSDRMADWVDAKADRAEAERTIARMMADEAERYRDRVGITVDLFQKPKTPPSSRN